MARLIDVARATGVSKATVSRALARPEMVAPDTRDRVLAAAARCGLRPNRAARALTTGRTGLIGLVVPTLANPFFAPLVLGAQESAAEREAYTLVSTSEHSARRERALVERLVGQVDGLIMVAPVGDDRVLQECAGRHPLVLVDRRAGRVPAVVLDTAAGVGAAVDHLAGCGHRRLAYLSGPSHSWADRQRRHALRTHADAAGVAVTMIGPLPPTFDAGLAAAGRLPPDVTAVIGYNGYVVLGLLHALTSAGVRVPDDISVVGGDDLPAFEALTPGITAVDVPVHEGGRQAVAMLQRLIDGAGADRPATLPTRLTLRGSTGRPRGPAALRP